MACAGPVDPVAGERQSAAIVADGDRRGLLRDLRVPAVIVHGDADPMVPVENAQELAEVIDGAELRVIEGLGHDIPAALVPEFVEAILAAAARSADG